MKVAKELKIGIITLLALVLGYICLNFLKGVEIFSPKNQYYVHFHNIGDVSTATPVKINGFKVGIVKEKELQFDEEEQIYVSILKLSLDPEVRLMKGCQIAIRSNMLTGTELIINMPKEKTRSFYADGDIVPSIEDGKGFMEVTQKEILPAVQEILPKVTEMLNNLNTILANKSIDTTMQNLQHSSALMEQAIRQLNQSLKPMPRIMENLAQSSTSLTQVAKQTEKIELESLMKNLQQTSENLKTITSNINSSQGSLGLLIKDKNLYHRVDSLANSADALLKDIRQHPKRYVKLSLF